MNRLENLLNYFAWRLAIDKNWYDNLNQHGVKPTQWPASAASNVARRYFDMREHLDHAKAAIRVSDLLQNLSADYSELQQADESILFAQYEIELKKFQMRTLGEALLKDPSNGEKYILNWQDAVTQDELFYLSDVIEGTYEKNIRQAAAKEAIRRIPQWDILSDGIGGFNPGRMGILIAKTGVGKTNLALNLALKASEIFDVAYFNMEMSKDDFTERAILSGTNAEYKTLKNDPEAIIQDFLRYRNDCCKKKFYFSGGRSLSLREIFSMARRHHKNHGLNFMVVDYDLKLDLDFEKNEQEWKALQRATEQFEELAKELDCYVLLLSQENEAGDIAGSKRAKHHAATVLRFYETIEGSGDFIIEALKNRFGKRLFKIGVNYEPSRSKVTERAHYVAPLISENKSKYTNPFRTKY